MRLCFVGDPGSIHTQRWVRWFARKHDVVIAATTESDALSDLRLCTLSGVRTLPRMRLATSVIALRGEVRRYQPDIIHAHFINEAGWLAAASGCRPLMISAWGSDIYRAPFESRLARVLNPWAVRSADFVTCDSADQARVLRSWGVSAGKVAVVGWGVDRDVFHPGVDGAGLKARLGIPANSAVVLSPRQWLPNSNIEVVIAAHAKLAADVFLILKRLPRSEHGRGGAVETAIAASPARDRIRVVDEIDESELPALYAAADVVVSLCTTDGTPVSLLEAMALGRPVVALGNESVSEWVSEPGGRIVASLDASAIARAVAAFLDGTPSRDVVANHNIAIVAGRADRAAEMARAGEIYARLHAGPGT